MCRLLAIYGTFDQWQPVVLDFCMQAETGNTPPGATPGHHDGWGMAAAYRTKGKMISIDRQLTPANLPQFKKTIDALADPPRNLLCHLRKASPGIAVSQKNIHPFFSDEWAFMHNGTVYNAQSLPRKESLQVISDNSDSEYLFHYFISEIMDKPDHRTIPSALTKAINKMTINYTSLTSILCSPDRMIVIRHLKKDPQYYTLYRCRLPQAVLFASEPVALNGQHKDHPWELIPNHTITAITGDGDIIEESHPIIKTE